ncbi:cytochrome P450 alkane hydroxylase-like protein [Lineolata rhizophorae]|uniref:Cytochrome P450 alkane hydroxylase-like protein n=1 Tax=Lineolata rhizophorae TaxID=578093 RepID=A0A6A6P2B9_9PEZI|nr:cytochrome P450 alkane hydroxylase-like protein [Lineolata rhizophorae]
MLDSILSSLTLTRVLVFLVAWAAISKVVAVFLTARKVRQLGHQAAIRRTWLPFSIDIIAEVIYYALNNRNYEFWCDMFRRYGNPAAPHTVEAGELADRTILTCDPENIKAILATQFADYGKGEEFNREWKAFLGDSIFTTDGQKWHESRTLIRPQFIKGRVSDLATFERHIAPLTELFGGAGQTVNVAELFLRYTLDAATDFLFGRSVESLMNPQAQFAHAFTVVQHVQSMIARAGPFTFLIPRGEFNKQLRVINEFVHPFIEQALLLSPQELEEKTKSDEGYTFLHALASYTRDRTVLRDQLVAVLLAARDTTAGTLSWAFYELSRQPHIVSKLREEILRRVGKTKLPTYDDLKEMKYLQHILNETLRLYPAVPFNVRVSLKDTTLPRGGGPNGDLPIGVFEGTQVGYSPLVMQRHPDMYPPESSGFPPVEKFVPERWDHWTPKTWTYIPFNGGPRICIGQQFALTEMAYTVVRVFQRFASVESRMPGQEPGLNTDIVLQPTRGVRVAFWEDKNNEGQW